MKKFSLNIEIMSFWHMGSGMGRGAASDSLVIRDRNGLPFIPGRTLKGLMREGMNTLEECGLTEPGRTDYLFGKSASDGQPESSVPGILSFSSAVMDKKISAWLAAPEGAYARSSLFDYIATTAINDNGLANDRTLRTMEICIPLNLSADVEGPDSGWEKDISDACFFVRSLGANRNRGLGRCRITLL